MFSLQNYKTSTSFPNSLDEVHRFHPHFPLEIRRTNSSDDVSRFHRYFELLQHNHGTFFTWGRYIEILQFDLRSFETFAVLSRAEATPQLIEKKSASKKCGSVYGTPPEIFFDESTNESESLKMECGVRSFEEPFYQASRVLAHVGSGANVPGRDKRVQALAEREMELVKTALLTWNEIFFRSKTVIECVGPEAVRFEHVTGGNDQSKTTTQEELYPHSCAPDTVFQDAIASEKTFFTVGEETASSQNSSCSDFTAADFNFQTETDHTVDSPSDYSNIEGQFEEQDTAKTFYKLVKSKSSMKKILHQKFHLGKAENTALLDPFCDRTTTDMAIDDNQEKVLDLKKLAELTSYEITKQLVMRKTLMNRSYREHFEDCDDRLILEPDLSKCVKYPALAVTEKGNPKKSEAPSENPNHLELGDSFSIVSLDECSGALSDSNSVSPGSETCIFKRIYTETRNFARRMRRTVERPDARPETTRTGCDSLKDPVLQMAHENPLNRDDSGSVCESTNSVSLLVNPAGSSACSKTGKKCTAKKLSDLYSHYVKRR